MRVATGALALASTPFSATLFANEQRPTFGGMTSNRNFYVTFLQPYSHHRREPLEPQDPWISSAATDAKLCGYHANAPDSAGPHARMHR
jgi:hypothetical protein